MEIVKEKPVKVVAGPTKIVGSGTVQLPVGLILQNLYAPIFSSDISAVQILSKRSKIRGYEVSFFLKQGTLDVLTNSAHMTDCTGCSRSRQKAKELDCSEREDEGYERRC